MLKVRFLTITSTTVGCLLLGSSYLPSIEANPAVVPSRGTAGSTSGASTNGSSILAPSRGTAGSTSGTSTTGSSLLGGLIQIREIVITPTIQTSLNNIGSLIIVSLTQAGGSSSSIAALFTLQVSNLSITLANTILTSVNVQGSTNSNPIPLPNGGSLVVTGNNSAAISINGTVTNISTTGANPQGSIAAAAAVLGAGGTPAQALLAASLAGTSTSVNPALVVSLVNLLTGLLSNSQASLPMPNLRAYLDNSTNLNMLTDTNSLREKSLVSTLPMVIAQGQGVSVNVEKLNKAILAYNDLIDASSPEALQALSKNKEFIIIGDNLRKLRAALAI
jgi:hypothetical protein